MSKKVIYVAFSNQKGGVGKSAFTTLAASYLHYAGGKNVAVIDCDYPQHSIHAMREREKSFVLAGDRFKRMLTLQHEQTGKKAYSVYSAKPENALEAAQKYFSEKDSNIDVVFFDLAGTVASDGILKSLFNMDYIFCPIIPDKLVIQSSLTFASAIVDCLAKYPDIPLKGIYFFWNQIVRNENREIYDAYSDIMKRMKLNVLKTEIPFTVKYKREMSMKNKQLFRSTLFPPVGAHVNDACLDLLIDEICQIINLK